MGCEVAAQGGAAWLTTTLVKLSATSALGLVSAATCLAYVAYLMLAYKEVSRLEARGGSDALPTCGTDNASILNVSDEAN